jgi:ABC-type lipopolysaccharide export system ATPase subunit
MVLILVINVVFKLYDKECLEVDSVQKQYDGKIIVSDVYLKCETADIIGI